MGFFDLFRRRASSPSSSANEAPLLTALAGAGDFSLGVVGESHYRRNCDHICGTTTNGVDGFVVSAVLVCEKDNPYDPEAVRVDVGGLPVGHLSRAMARKYRARLSDHDLDEQPRSCRAMIRGGWDRGGEDRGEYGIKLDLDLTKGRRRSATPTGVPTDEPRSREVSVMKETAFLDEHGQPPRRLYRDRVNDRLVAELLGVVKGAICDGVVTDTEARALGQWVDAHPDVVAGFPGDVIADRLARVFADGRIDDDEREDLMTLLRDLVGEPAEHTGALNHATRLPLDDPPPSLTFVGHEYVLTGKFAFGTRKKCEQAVIERGGTVHSDVRARTNVLVVGTFGSDAWVQSSWGRKILAAMDVRNAGHPIRIVAEEHWVSCLERPNG